MSYSLDIELDDYLVDSIDSALNDIEEAVANVRKSHPESVSTTVDIDIHDLLARHQAIALIWDADMLLSTYPHLTKEQAWEVLQECERNYTAENGLSWDDVAAVVQEMFPDPTEMLHERVARIARVLDGYTDFDAQTNLVDLLADARHWSDQHGHDFSALNGQAYQHYLNERNHKEP